MNWLMPHTTTATQLQRNYKKVAKMAKKVKAPIVVLSNNKPEGVYIDYATFSNNASIVNQDKNKSKGGIETVFGSWTDEEADEFDRIINDAFERVNPDDWK